MEPTALATLTAWCAVLGWFDLRHRRLPNSLTTTGAAAILGYALGTTRFTVAVTGGLLLAALYLAIHLLAPAALGAGDVKLAVGLGAASALGGAQAWVWAALGAPTLTAAAGVAVLAARRADHGVPHGPSMGLATLVALIATAS
ncbi:MULTISPECIES: prepilin peptidase [Nocardia]|uniref:prepilin peptidase n=1 Tax=Nocardia TaxID=1817 RepID=UPI000D69D2DE|nr:MULTISPECIES: A24 family peptidase [Nocardia]